MSTKKIDMVAEAKAFCEEKNITAGWMQQQHIGLQARTIRDALGVESKEDIDTLVSILSQTVNPSAFRQGLERAGVLMKSGGKAAINVDQYL